jgi:tetratricopeptide (TPR) repeat protein
VVLQPGREQPWAAVVAELEAALQTFRRSGQVVWHAMAMLTLGNLYRGHARLDLANLVLGDCVDLFGELGVREWAAAALFSQGSLRVVEGDLRGAVASYRGCLDIFDLLGDELWQAYTRRALGYAYQQHRHFDAAVAELDRALPVLRAHGEQQMWQAHTTLTLGLAQLGLHRTHAAIEHLDESLAVFRAYGDPRSEALALRGRARAGTGPEAETYLRAALASFLRLEDPVGTALTLRDLGELCRQLGNPEEADRCLALARSVIDELSLPALRETVTAP